MKTVLKYFLAFFIMVSCNKQQKEILINNKVDFEKAIDSLLVQMSLEEKIEQLSGTGFDTKPNERLGISSLRMTDGPVGIRWGKATALPAAISLASSWDKELMFKVGQLLGSETKAKGRNFFLGPCVNIHRFPVGGRNFESFGEDPYLAGQIAIPYIEGVQSQNVLACVKHFACNNQEWARSQVNAVVDERALHEIYFPAFKAAVQKAHVWSVMSSYNKVNGHWAAENAYLLDTILKKKWGFKGFVVSDWGATHSTVGSLKAGLDLEMPFGDYFNVSSIKKALDNNEITESQIDDKVRRLLRVRFESNMFNQNQETEVSEQIINSKKHKAIAYEAAVDGIVLLKNKSNILPINFEKVKKIAVIGPNAAQARIGGGGSSKVTPFYAVSPLEGLKNKLDKQVEINYALGTIIDGDIQIIENQYFEPINGVKGLKADYYANINCQGKERFNKIDGEVNFLWYYDAPREDLHGADDRNLFSVRWTGKLRAEKSGVYTFNVMHNDGVRFMINNKLLINEWKDLSGNKIESAKIHLNKGEVYDIQLEYYNNGGVSEIKLGWEIPDTNLMQDAVALAKKSDLAIVFVGLSDHFEGEGRDMEYLTLKNQDKLINQVVAVNPNTIVVVISGIPPIMDTWADNVPGILQAWFAGQEGGNAIADILLGNRNPSGKLPCTFYKYKNDSPGFGDYKNKDFQSVYSEGIYVGYRYLDKNKLEARFPFGHGLSYSKFSYGKPTYKWIDKDSIEVKFKLTNEGKMFGSEVVQLYLKPIKTTVERPEKELKAFKKVCLNKNETRDVSLILDKSSFQYYDETLHDWKLDKGEYNILIGSSSKDIRQIIEDVFVE